MDALLKSCCQCSYKFPLDIISCPITWPISVVFCDKCNKPYFLNNLSLPSHFPKPDYVTLSLVNHIFSHLQSSQEKQLFPTMPKNQPNHPPVCGYMKSLTKIICQPDDLRKRLPQPSQIWGSLWGCFLYSAQNRQRTAVSKRFTELPY